MFNRSVSEVIRTFSPSRLSTLNRKGENYEDLFRQHHRPTSSFLIGAGGCPVPAITAQTRSNPPYKSEALGLSNGCASRGRAFIHRPCATGDLGTQRLRGGQSPRSSSHAVGCTRMMSERCQMTQDTRLLSLWCASRKKSRISVGVSPSGRAITLSCGRPTRGPFCLASGLRDQNPYSVPDGNPWWALHQINA